MESQSTSSVIGKGEISLKKNSTLAMSLRYTRRNMVELSRAVRAVRLFSDLQQSLWPDKYSDISFTDLECLFIKLIKSDKQHEHGQRRIMDGNFKILKGFQYFNTQEIGNHLEIKAELEPDCKTCRVSIKPGFRQSTMLVNMDLEVSIIPVAMDFARESWMTGSPQDFSVKTDEETEAIELRCHYPATFEAIRLLFCEIRWRGLKNYRCAMAAFL